ncbi:MAG TPA: SIR2 family protein, partial [Planctomycetaceae bacterium]|nr:SIR2 family protein [Planctomycetaceae bacterium]
CDRALHGSPRMLRTIERASKSTHADKVPLYHLHGYLLPFPNTEAKREAADRLILTEQEYIARTDQPYHWAATILHWALVESPVVFIGCSMVDELCRRALYRTRAQRIEDATAESVRRGRRQSVAKHFAVCKLSDEATNSAIEQSYALLDLNPVWGRNYTTELPDRLSELRKRLAGTKAAR